ncbi:MAG: hypothetical protein JXR95_06070 [Deltaproteobacteria bacterium]|nr:hypothetical protein [Deltaproteobacteria bacterium]
MTEFFSDLGAHGRYSLRIFVAGIFIFSLFSGLKYFPRTKYIPGEPLMNLALKISSESSLKVNQDEIVVGSELRAGEYAVFFLGSSNNNGKYDFYFTTVKFGKNLIPIELSKIINISNTADYSEKKFSVFDNRAVYFDGHKLILADISLDMLSSSLLFIHNLLESVEIFSIWKINKVDVFSVPENWKGVFRLSSRDKLEVLDCADTKKWVIIKDISHIFSLYTGLPFFSESLGESEYKRLISSLSKNILWK